MKVGRLVVLLLVLVWNSPGSTVVATVNCLALEITVTVNVLLYPVLVTPEVFSVLVTLRVSTTDPTDKSWGTSVV